MRRVEEQEEEVENGDGVEQREQRESEMLCGETSGTIEGRFAQDAGDAGVGVVDHRCRVVVPSIGMGEVSEMVEGGARDSWVVIVVGGRDSCVTCYALGWIGEEIGVAEIAEGREVAEP